MINEEEHIRPRDVEHLQGDTIAGMREGMIEERGQIRGEVAAIVGDPIPLTQAHHLHHTLVHLILHLLLEETVSSLALHRHCLHEVQSD